MDGKYNYNMSKVCDTVFYMTIYFRENDFFTYLRNRYTEINFDEAMRGYFDFKEQHKSLVLQPEISAFVHTDYQAGLKSFLVNVLHDNLNFESHTKDGVTAFLQDSVFIREKFWERLFPKKDDRIAERIISGDSTLNVSGVFGKLNIPENIKLHYMAMASDFPKYQRELIATFNDVYGLVDKYYSEHQHDIVEIKNQITDNLSNRLHKIYKLPNSVLSFPFYFSLFNGLLLDYHSLRKNICFGLGKNFMDAIDAHCRCNHISFNSFSKILYVEARAEMIDMFLKYRCLCASEIAEGLHIAKSTVHAHLSSMLMEGMINCAYPAPGDNSGRVYFSINPDYFKVYAGLLADLNKKAYRAVSDEKEEYETDLAAAATLIR